MRILKYECIIQNIAKHVDSQAPLEHMRGLAYNYNIKFYACFHPFSLHTPVRIRTMAPKWLSTIIVQRQNNSASNSLCQNGLAKNHSIFCFLKSKHSFSSTIKHKHFFWSSELKLCFDLRKQKKHWINIVCFIISRAVKVKMQKSANTQCFIKEMYCTEARKQTPKSATLINREIKRCWLWKFD